MCQESIINPSEAWLLERISDLYDWIDYYEYELNAFRDERRKKGYVPIFQMKTGLFWFILFSSVFGFKCPSTLATYRWKKFLIFWIRRYKNLWPNVVLSVSNSKRYVMLLDTSGLYQHIPKRKIQPKYFNSWKVSSLFYKVPSILNVNMT